MTAADPLARPSLTTIAAAYGAVVIERQMALNVIAHDVEWTVDLNNRILQLGGRSVRITLLGSSSDATGAWNWAWDSAQYGPEHPAVQPTELLRHVGQRYGIPEFSHGSVPLNQVYDGGQGPSHTMSVAACGLLAGQAYFPANYDGGTAWLVVDDDSVTVHPPTIHDAVQVIGAAVSAFPHDNRLTLETYLAVHDVLGVADARTITASFLDGEAEFAFDDAGELVDVNALGRA